MEYENLIVKIIYPTFQSTGFFIGNGLILSCAHCFHGTKFTLGLDETLKGAPPNSDSISSIIKDENSDLWLIYSDNLSSFMKTLNLKFPKIATRPIKIGETVFSWGYSGLCADAKLPDLVRGSVSFKKPGALKIQAPVNCGNSGGPVLVKNKETKEFELTGIVNLKIVKGSLVDSDVFDINEDFLKFEKALLPLVESLKIDKISDQFSNVCRRMKEIDLYANYGFGFCIDSFVVMEFLNQCKNRVVICEHIRKAVTEILTEETVSVE